MIMLSCKDILKSLDFFKHLIFFNFQIEQVKRYFCFLIFIEAELIYNIVLVSGVQQSDSVIRTHISLFFRFFLPYSLL